MTTLYIKTNSDINLGNQDISGIISFRLVSPLYNTNPVDYKIWMVQSDILSETAIKEKYSWLTFITKIQAHIDGSAVEPDTTIPNLEDMGQTTTTYSFSLITVEEAKILKKELINKKTKENILKGFLFNNKLIRCQEDDWTTYKWLEEKKDIMTYPVELTTADNDIYEVSNSFELQLVCNAGFAWVAKNKDEGKKLRKQVDAISNSDPEAITKINLIDTRN
jgi:hypothetical protein